MPQRNVTITPQQDEFVESALISGRYGNVSEVFRAGLRLLEREEQEVQIRGKWFQHELDKGIEAVHNGDYSEINSPEELNEFFEVLKQEREIALNGQSE